MPRKLKVFRTPIGFHDAYVAAPSQKAALEAWGADANLFARGTAEQVTDPALTAEPLKHPGEVIRVSRGDLKAQLKALGPRKKVSPKKAPKARREPKAVARNGTSKPRRPPRRDKVDRAEAALAEAREKQAKERGAIDEEREALDRKAQALKARHAKSIARLEARLEQAQEAYRAALEAWSG
jgi:hypothetical protein